MDFDGTVYDTAVVERFVGVCVGLLVRTHTKTMPERRFKFHCPHQEYQT